MSVFAVVKALATEEEAVLLAELEVRLADLKLNAEEHGESMVAEEGEQYCTTRELFYKL